MILVENINDYQIFNNANNNIIQNVIAKDDKSSALYH
jgi:hypothetical protein